MLLKTALSLTILVVCGRGQEEPPPPTPPPPMCINCKGEGFMDNVVQDYCLTAAEENQKDMAAPCPDGKCFTSLVQRCTSSILGYSKPRPREMTVVRGCTMDEEPDVACEDALFQKLYKDIAPLNSFSSFTLSIRTTCPAAEAPCNIDNVLAEGFLCDKMKCGSEPNHTLMTDLQEYPPGRPTKNLNEPLSNGAGLVRGPMLFIIAAIDLVIM